MTEPVQPEEAYFLEYETSFLAVHANLANFVSMTQHLRDLAEQEDKSETGRPGQLRRAAMLGTIVFSAITLEGAINYFGRMRQIPYYKDIEKSLSALNKWRLFPRLAGRAPVKEHILERIDIVFALRDRVVHPKPRLIRLNEPFRIFMPQEAAYLVNTLDMAIDAIGLDPISEDLRIYLGEIPGAVKPDKDISLL